MTPRMHEDAARFARQYLLAIEDGRDHDADLLKEWVASEFGVSLAYIAGPDVPPALIERWSIPERAQRMGIALLLNFGREPVWRIPDAVGYEDGDPPSAYETPLGLIPPDVLTGDPFVGGNAPAHLQPRLPESGPLPDHIQAAIRPWSRPRA